MSVKVTVRQVQEQLPELMQRAVETGESCVVQRDGRDYAVIVGVREWKRRRLGTSLDSLGPAYRLTIIQQQRTEELLAESKQRRLTRAEQRELNTLVYESEEVLLRRTAALERLL
jgi:antitoxin (DNA-binding transcriptional repressor) of toxin-antitoxin stability system